MPAPTSPKHASEWSPWWAAVDESAAGPGTSRHRGNLIDAFRKHLTRRFGNR